MNLTLTVTLIIVHNGKHNSRVDKEKAESTVSNQAWLDLNYNELWTVSIVSTLGWFSNRTGTSVDDGKERRKYQTQLLVPSLPLCHWSSQLFNLRALSSTDVPILLLNQPNVQHQVHSFNLYSTLIWKSKIHLCIARYHSILGILNV